MPPRLQTTVDEPGETARPNIDAILGQPDRSWSVLHLKTSLLELEEKLHFQLLWQRVGKVWLFLGNGLLWALVIIGDVLSWKRIDSLLPYLYIAAVASSVVSPLVVYHQYKKTRETRLKLRRLNILYRHRLSEDDGGNETSDGSTLVKQKRYRGEMLDLISQFREEANRNRGIHNRFQTIIIVGSVTASAITTASVSYSQVRWGAVVVTAVVGLAAGFTGYFKYHERSFNLQQTADAIEREYEAVELRVGRYVNLDDQNAYALFADLVEKLTDEQNKRQQQLDQPVEVKKEE